MSGVALARALVEAVAKPQGDLRGVPASDLLEVPAVRRRAALSPTRLRWFRRACELPDDGVVPPTFVETLFIAPLARLVIDRRFPLSPLGLIHVGQTVVVRRALAAGDTLELTRRMSAARESERGVELECSMLAEVGGETAWQGVAALLSRNRATRGRAGAGNNPRPGRAAPAPGPTDGPAPRLFRVPAHTGLAYAAASTDFNPHHLTRLTARPLGYRRPIAHGMWTLARALGLAAEIEPLPRQLRVEARFKRPLFLPGTAAFVAKPAAGAARELVVCEPESRVPHLIATLTSGSEAA